MVIFQTGMYGMVTGDQVRAFFNGGYSTTFDIGVDVDGGPFGGPALQFYDNGQASHILAIPRSMVIQSFRWKTDAMMAGNNYFARFMGSDGVSDNVIAYVGADVLGRIIVKNGSGAVVATSAATGLYGPNSYHHVQAKLTVTGFDDGLNTIDFTIVVKHNNVTVINYSGTTTGYNGVGEINKVGFVWANGGANLWVTDYFVQDAVAGPDASNPNQDFIGEARTLGILLPNAAGTHTDLTPTPAVANYLNVDEDPPDGDTTYNSSNTVGHIDTYNFPDISLPAGSEIISAQHNILARKTDSGSRSLAGVVRSPGGSGTDYVGLDNHPTDGVGVSLGLTYQALKQVLNADPDTDLRITEAGFNSMEFGSKVTA